jgi:hypothetical protein
MLVLAMMMASEPLKRRTTNASSGGTDAFSAMEPPLVAMSAVSMLSFSSTGTQ